jgi:tRNA G18 (ribose-2'-O)-methylase SpoU
MGERAAIVVGEERAGLSARAGEICDVQARLPMCGKADSINVGVAAGVMMYEVVRRRGREENPKPEIRMTNQ